MSVTIELPEEIEQQLETEWGDLPRRALEALAIEGYRSGALTQAQVRRMLGYETSMEVDGLLKQAGLYLEQSIEDVERDTATSRRISSQHRSTQ